MLFVLTSSKLATDVSGIPSWRLTDAFWVSGNGRPQNDPKLLMLSAESNGFSLGMFRVSQFSRNAFLGCDCQDSNSPGNMSPLSFGQHFFAGIL